MIKPVMYILAPPLSWVAGVGVTDDDFIVVRSHWVFAASVVCA